MIHTEYKRGVEDALAVVRKWLMDVLEWLDVCWNSLDEDFPYIEPEVR